MTAVRYAPEVFMRADLNEAKQIILTPEVGLTTDQRWTMETDWLMDRIMFDHQGLVIDYCCGVGRLAKRLTTNPVLGIDIAPQMRANADQYVERSEFGAVSPQFLKQLVKSGLRANGAISTWVLQHCLDPAEDIGLLASALETGSQLFVLNCSQRVVPTIAGSWFRWNDDGVDIQSLLSDWFDLELIEPMPSNLCAPGAQFTVWRRNETMQEIFP